MSFSLPQAIFEALVKCDSVRMDRGKGSERRGDGRVRMSTRVQVIPMSDHLAGKPTAVQVRDISHTGIGLLLNTKVSPKDSLLVQFTTREIRLWVLCDVARAEKVSEGLYVIGAMFNRIVEPRRSMDSKPSDSGKSAPPLQKAS